MRAFATFALFACLGCATLPKPGPEFGGEGPWRELTSAHFRVFTDVDEDRARERVLDLERRRAVVLRFLGATAEVPGRMDAVIFRTPAQFRAYRFSEKYAGFMVIASANPLAAYLDEGFQQDSNAPYSPGGHELVHYLAAHRLRNQPRWVSEGLAGYLETLKFAGDQVTIGRPSESELHTISALGREPLRDLWDWRGFSETKLRMAKLYASSWLWVHYLANVHAARFRDFLDRLGRAGEPSRKAWDEAFEGIRFSDLEQSLTEYTYSPYPVQTLGVPSIPSEISVRPALPADLHLLFARLWLEGPRLVAREDAVINARIEVGEAKRADPLHLEARALEIDLTDSPAAAVPLARALTTQRPDSGRGWLFLGERLSATGAAAAEVDAAFEQAEKNAGDDALVSNNVAMQHLKAGRAARAVPLAQAAAGRAPWNAAYHYVLAAALAESGRCKEAEAAQLQAVGLLGEWATDADFKRFSERLADIRAKCVAKAD